MMEMKLCRSRIAHLAIRLLCVVGILMASFYWFADYRGFDTDPSLRSARPPFDPHGYRFTFERTACFGECPAFELEVNPDLTTRLRLNTSTEPQHERPRYSSMDITGSISRKQVLQLIASVEHGEFWKLDQDYSAMVTDSPSTYIQVATPERRWSVAVSAVRCQSQRSMPWDLGKDVKPVPDVFCALADKLDAIACLTYEQGEARALRADEQIYFPPDCPATGQQ